MSRKVLYIGVHAWTSPIRVGSHGIAGELARRGWDVAYVSAPLSVFNFMSPGSRYFESRFREFRSGGCRDEMNGVWHYVPFAFVTPTNRPLLGSRWMFHNWQRFCIPNLLKVVQDSGFGNVDVLFLDTIYQPFWLDAITYKKSVLRLADNNSGFSGFGAGARAVEVEAIARADRVVTASRALCDWVTSAGAREAMYMPNGIDLARFDVPDPGKPAQYVEVTGPIAVFVGTLGDWVDLDLVHECALAMPDVTFFLIGPRAGTSADRDVPPNVRYLGVVPHDEVLPFLRHADVGLIPFRSSRRAALIDHINPLKLYEYLAAGLPVVSTDWPEIAGLRSPARLCASTDAFIAAIRDVLKNPRESAQYQAFASSAGWSARLESLAGWMESL